MSHVLRLLAVTAGAAAAATLVPTLAASPASAAADAPRCVAYGALPSRVSLDRSQVTVVISLRGSSGCTTDTRDHGATADFVAPSGDDLALRWDKFGGTQKAVLEVTLSRTGRYTVGRGDVQVYDTRYERVPWQWQSTATVVKRGARFVHVAASRREVTARLQDYSKYGWQGVRGVRVSLQHRAGPGAPWHTVRQATTGRNGAVAVPRGSTAGQWRLASPATAQVWGATAGA